MTRPIRAPIAVPIAFPAPTVVDEAASTSQRRTPYVRPPDNCSVRLQTPSRTFDGTLADEQEADLFIDKIQTAHSAQPNGIQVIAKHLFASPLAVC
jgi:hypothetical protein